MLRVCFRLDATKTLGLGHLFRCLNLAKALREERVFDSFLFVGKFESVEIEDMILKNGFDFVNAEAGASKRVIESTPDISCVVVDHYEIASDWERSFYEENKVVVVIDDLNNRNHHCHILVDQSFGKQASCYESLMNVPSRLLVGADYALLAPEFSKNRMNTSTSKSNLRTLVSFGGVDPHFYGLQCLEMLSEEMGSFKKHSFTLVSGYSPAYQSKVEAFTTRLGLENVVVKSFVEDMSREIGSHDFVIGAGGVSTYERCCLKRPSITFATAENQLDNIRGVSSKGATLYLGEASNMKTSDLKNVFFELDHAQLEKMSTEAAKVADGQGIYRLTREISKLSKRSK